MYEENNGGMCIGCIAKSIDYQILSMSSYLLIVLLIHCRYERNVRVHNRAEKVRTSSRTCTAKQAVEPTPAQGLLLLISMKTMTCISLLCLMNVVHIRRYEKIFVIDDIDIGPNNHDEIQTDEHPAISHIRRIPIVKVESNDAEANLGNTANRSNESIVVDFEDRMEPEKVNTEVGNNSVHEMWVSREFLNRQTFRNTLAKFAIYANFTLKHLKTNLTKVRVGCKDRDCPWWIYASIVESGPQFKVRTYNPKHRCSKPMMGMAH